MADHPPITCAGCKKKFKTKADVRGKRIKCPFCQESFLVPLVEESADDDDAPIAVEGLPKPKPEVDSHAAALAQSLADMEEGDDPYAVTHLDLAPRCPNCANEMPSAEAVVCLVCGYNTLTREWGKTEKTIGITFGRHFVYLLPGLLVLFTMFSIMVSLIMFATYWPFWVAEKSWIDWTDHESLRMWSTTVGMIAIAGLGSYCFKRLIVKPLPEEIQMEEGPE